MLADEWAREEENKMPAGTWFSQAAFWLSELTGGLFCTRKIGSKINYSAGYLTPSQKRVNPKCYSFLSQ